jgi:hypothetical protein
MPLCALFILFDLVVYNPTHAETRNNLALLDMAGGYFSRLEYAAGASLPSSILSEFADIAREYLRDTALNAGEPFRCNTSGQTSHIQSAAMTPATSSYPISDLDTVNQASVPEYVDLDQLYYPTVGWAGFGVGFEANREIMNLFGSTFPDDPTLPDSEIIN